LPALVFGLFRPFQLFGLLDKGRGDLCCTAVSIDLWTIDLPRPSNHKILDTTGRRGAPALMRLEWAMFA